MNMSGTIWLPDRGEYMSETKQMTLLSETVNVRCVAESDFISITGVARFRNVDDPGFVIRNWMWARSSVEFTCIWNVLNMASFGMTAKQWQDANPGEEGNIRDRTNATQLVCLANLGNPNVPFISEGLVQSEHKKPNCTVIEQMEILTANRNVKRLEGGKA
uniref:Uncharacterized protein n=1 Tax=Candidatus Kentrum sp. LFY TaxID=2126342 RepID=A0A450V6H6_9GAMM|nr:MAG: hypothetical protein BECKLFY1418A_GA0070994_11167 [Candidatus Kentron sp. LFY]